LGHSALWGRFNIRWVPADSTHPTHQRKRFEEMLIHQITRCRASPTHILIFGSFNGQVKDSTDTMLTLLFSTSQSWKSLDLFVGHDCSPLLAGLSGCLSSLETLTLVIPQHIHSSSTYWDDLRTSCQYLPGLRRLGLSTLNDLPLFSFPTLSSVQHFRTIGSCDLSSGRFREAIVLMPNLQVSELSVYQVGATFDLCGAVELGSLQVLSVRSRLTVNVSTLLKDLHLPSFVELDISMPRLDNHGMDIVGQLVASTLFRKLGLTSLHAKPEIYTRYSELRDIHSLEELTFFEDLALVNCVIGLLEDRSHATSLRGLTPGLTSIPVIPVDPRWVSTTISQFSKARPELALTVFHEYMELLSPFSSRW